MIEIFHQRTKFDFVSNYKFTGILSVTLVILSVILALTKMPYGVDFRGGAEIQIKFKQHVSLDHLRSTLEADGFKGVSVQTIGDVKDNECLVKVQAHEDLNKLTADVGRSLEKNYSAQGTEVRKIDIVGPKAGAHLRFSGFMAMAWSMIAIMIYLGIRFDFKYAPGAVLALIHDCAIVLGIYALTGTEFTLQTVAALLTIIGYSTNDTVIVYDRIREHEHKYPGLPLSTHINNAINETLSRTVLTSGATLFVSVTMYFFGGIAIRDFFLALTIGIVVGTYSSIYIASPVTLWLEHFKVKKTA
ncbi:MAG: protein translocase subunit SecF [Pseudomonadota bacterium]